MPRHVRAHLVDVPATFEPGVELAALDQLPVPVVDLAGEGDGPAVDRVLGLDDRARVEVGVDDEPAVGADFFSFLCFIFSWEYRASSAVTTPAGWPSKSKREAPSITKR